MDQREYIPVRTILATIGMVIGIAVALGLLYSLRHLLFDLVVAIFLSLVLSPGVTWLQHRGVPRGWAITIVFTVVVLTVSGIAASIAAPLANQGANVARHAPTYLRQAEHGKGPLGRVAHRFHLERQLARAVPAVSKSLSKVSSRLIGVGRSVASAAARTAIVLVLTVFMLVEGPRTVTAIETAIPRDRRASMVRIGRHIASTVSSYTLGILMLAVLNGIVTAAALVTMRVPFVLPLAMWAGVVDILPIIGGLLAIAVAGLFGFTKGIAAGIVVVVVMLVYQQIKNHLLYPIVVGRAVQLNALIVLVAVLAGAELSGISGAILAIPVAAVIHVGLTELLGPRLRWLTEGGPPSPVPAAALPPAVLAPPPPAPAPHEPSGDTAVD